MNKEIVSLTDLKIGEKGILVEIKNSSKAFRRRLLDMGLTKNVLITIEKISPLGDPISVELRGYQLCLRKEDIKDIMVMKEDK